MRPWSLILLFFICTSFVGLSQNTPSVIPATLVEEYEQGSPDEIAQIQTDRLVNGVVLSPEQIQNTFQVNKKVAQKIAAVKQNSALSAAQKEEFVNGNLQDRRHAMSLILDAAQFAVFDALDYQ